MATLQHLARQPSSLPTAAPGAFRRSIKAVMYSLSKPCQLGCAGSVLRCAIFLVCTLPLSAALTAPAQTQFCRPSSRPDLLRAVVLRRPSCRVRRVTTWAR